MAYRSGGRGPPGGALFVGAPLAGPVCGGGEGAGGGLMVVKEYLGAPAARRLALPGLPQAAPAERWLVRQPMAEDGAASGGWKFAMLKWLDPGMAACWDWDSTAYLGLAFD